jgi:hypothetical protein
MNISIGPLEPKGHPVPDRTYGRVRVNARERDQARSSCATDSARWYGEDPSRLARFLRGAYRAIRQQSMESSAREIRELLAGS